MAVYPGATYKPTSFGGKVERNRQGRGMLHVAVSRARSLPPSSERATWHFYVALDGYCEQYVDTDYRAYGGAEGNDDQLIIETAGGTGTSAQLNAEKWTPAQAERIADIMRWEASQPGGAPLELLPDARPGRRGWGPHRLGIKHSAGPRPGWWQPGSELWSNALGKECPGDAKVAQVPSIIELARSGQTEDDMFDDTDRAKIDRILGALEEGGGSTGRNNFSWLADQVRAELANIRAMLRGGFDPKSGKNNFHWLAEQLTAAVASIPGATVDAEQLQAAIASSVTFTEESLAKAVNDEEDRRERERLGGTPTAS